MSVQTAGVGLRLRKALKSNQAAMQRGAAKHPAWNSCRYALAPASCGRERDRQSLAQSWAQQGVISGLGASTQPNKQPREQTCGLSSSAATSENKNTNACLLLKLFHNIGYV